MWGVSYANRKSDMKFLNDILLIDFEGLGTEPLQIGALLLDKETLEEKESFVSYIYADLKGMTLPVSWISQDMLNGAPSKAEVGRMIFEKFGTSIMLGSWVADLDRTHFKKIIAAAGVDITLYDYHFFDIWPVAYLYLLKRGYTGGIHSEEMFQAFGANPRGLHNALEDCRIEAKILRNIIVAAKFENSHC